MESFILIPQVVSDKSATVWVAAIDANVRTLEITLRYNVCHEKGDAGDFDRLYVQLAQSDWRTWKTRNPLENYDESNSVRMIHYQRVVLRGLEQRTKYTVKLEVRDPKKAKQDEKEILGQFQDYSKTLPFEKAVSEPVVSEDYVSTATVTTLPGMIPTEKDNDPFRVMVGSCFYQPNDPDGMVGHTYLNMPEKSMPEIKLLCGDQVYLDNPWRETTLGLLSPEKMRTLFLEKYLRTWTQIRKGDVTDEQGVVKRKVIGGFNPLLRNGANYFISDDHEFWNNAPNFGIVGALMTAVLSQRRFWFREASELFRIFQSMSPWVTFDIWPLSFCIADTRINRTRHNLVRRDEKAQFMEQDDLNAVIAWISDLQGPGILVLGQIFLTEEASRLKYLYTSNGESILKRTANLFNDYADFGLPDFPLQYKALLGAMKQSKHTIVVISGDVHYGRYSACTINPESDVNFVEVISSPMTCVSGGVFKDKPTLGRYEEASGSIFETRIGSDPIAQVDFPERKTNDHFVTLEFSLKNEVTKEVNMAVKSWEILQPNEIFQAVEPREVQTVVLK